MRMLGENEELDPGIRETVAWLRARGYNTTDSGDGKSKANLIAQGIALAIPHVFVLVPFSSAYATAHALADDLAEIGVVPGPHTPFGADLSIEIRYSPFDRTTILMLCGLDDGGLRYALSTCEVK